MPKGIAIVAHRVSTDPEYCVFNALDDGFGEKSMCRYLKYRDRTHGRQKPVEKQLPRCDLFRVWLDQPGLYSERCDACKIACGEVEQDAEE